MRNALLTKAFSIFTSLALVLCSFPAAAFMPGETSTPNFVKTLTPADTLGSVVSSYDAGGAKMPRLIVIADLHGHIGVQENIIGMLESLVGRLTSTKTAMSEQRVPIFIEGGWTPHLEGPLDTIQNPKTRAILGQYLLRKAELAAGQAYSEQHIGATNFTITGVENHELYEANRKRFAETYPMRKALLQAIVRQERAMHVLENYVEPHAYGKLQAVRQSYLKGLIAPTDYARTLEQNASRLGIQNELVDELRHPDAIYEDRLDVVLTAVHAMVLNGLAQSRPMSSYLRPNIKNEDQVRLNVALADGSLDLLKRVLGDQLAPEEVPYAIAQIARLTQVAQILLAKDKLNIDIGEALRKSLDFYAFAFLRDRVLVNNALKELSKDTTHPETGILIAGGFHTGSIGEYLKEQHIPYMVINPVVARDMAAEEQLNYIKRICDEHVTPDEVAYDMHRPWGRQLTESRLPLPVNTIAVAAPPVQAARGFFGSIGSAMSRALSGSGNVASTAQAVKTATSEPALAAGNAGAFGGTAQVGNIAAAVEGSISADHLALLNQIVNGQFKAEVAEGGFVLENRDGKLQSADGQSNSQMALISNLIQELSRALGSQGVQLKKLVVQPLADTEGNPTEARAAWNGDQAAIFLPAKQMEALADMAENKAASQETGRVGSENPQEVAVITTLHEALHNLVLKLRAYAPENATPAQKKVAAQQEAATRVLAFAYRAAMIQAANAGTVGDVTFASEVTQEVAIQLFNEAQSTLGSGADIAAAADAISGSLFEERMTAAQLADKILYFMTPQAALENPEIQALIDNIAKEQGVPRAYAEEAAQEVFSGPSGWEKGWAAMNGEQIPPEEKKEIEARTEKKARGWLASLYHA